MAEKVLGYQYEPRKTLHPDSDSEIDSSWECIYDSDEEKEVRDTDDLSSWCKCDKCIVMPTAGECVCCHNLPNAYEFELQEGNQFYYSIAYLQ